MAELLTQSPDSPPSFSSLNMTSVLLPRFFGLKSNYNDKYLRYVNEDVQAHGFLQFSGEEVVSPYSKFEVETAKTGKGLVHLRCGYNNKYWARSSPNNYWIVAGGDEPEENQSKWSCTLFEPVHIDAQTIRLRHVQLGNYVCLWRIDPPFGLCAFAGSASIDKDKCDVLTIIDWESFLILPRHVAFKGDNGSYLGARTIEGYPFLQFASKNIGDPTVGNEVLIARDGNVRIKSDHFGKFWRRSPDWILADSSDSTSGNPDTLFWPVKVDRNIVALRNLGNNNFCKRLTTEGKKHCLNAGVSTITTEARLEVSEIVLSRDIYNVNFRPMDARIYDQHVLTMANGTAFNRTQEPNTLDIKFSYTDTKSSTWDSSVSLKLGVKVSLVTGIPLIAEGKIEISTEFTGTYAWGSTKSTTNVLEYVYKVIAPPMTSVRVSVLATKASCDIPFSYTQSDTLTDGRKVTYFMHDGVFSGINTFNFRYEAKQEPL